MQTKGSKGDLHLSLLLMLLSMFSHNLASFFCVFAYDNYEMLYQILKCCSEKETQNRQGPRSVLLLLNRFVVHAAFLSLGTQNDPKLRECFGCCQRLMMFQLACILCVQTQVFGPILVSNSLWNSIQ